MSQDISARAAVKNGCDEYAAEFSISSSAVNLRSFAARGASDSSFK